MGYSPAFLFFVLRQEIHPQIATENQETEIKIEP